MNEKRKWGTAKRRRRGAVVIGVVGLAAATGLLTAGVALAGVGAQPGDLELLVSGVSQTSVALSSTPTWATTTACPSGYQGSAVITEYTAPGGAEGSEISSVNNTVTSPFNGTLDSSVGALLAFSPIDISATAPGTAEWVVGCYTGSGATGSFVNEQSIFLTVATGATSATLSSTGPVTTPTSTTLTASPSPAQTGATVTLTATETPATTGNVQFEVGGTDIGGPVAVNSSGVATTTDTFSSPGTQDLSAVFTPSGTAYSGSTGTYDLLVQQAGSVGATGSPVTVSFTIPPSGSLSVSVTPSTVSLTLNTAGTQATGTLGNVTVTDSRNSYPGWSVSGQEAAFAGSGTAAGQSIAGDQLGWSPAAVGTLGTGVTLGPLIAPGTSPGGLGDTGGVLFSATPGNGFGTNEANAALTLDIPTGQVAGAYAGSLTITYLSTGP